MAGKEEDKKKTGYMTTEERQKAYNEKYYKKTPKNEKGTYNNKKPEEPKESTLREDLKVIDDGYTLSKYDLLKISQMPDKKSREAAAKEAGANSKDMMEINRLSGPASAWAAQQLRAASVVEPEVVGKDPMQTKTAEKNLFKEDLAGVADKTSDEDLLALKDTATNDDAKDVYTEEAKERNLIDPDPEESKNAQTEIADSFGINPDGLNEDTVKDLAESGEANKIIEEILPEVTASDGSPLPMHEVLPSEDPTSGLNWFQRLAPLLSVLSLAISSVAIANDVLIPPVNFNKISNRDEAYQAYLEIIKADQEQKNADANTLESVGSAKDYKDQLEAARGEGAFDEGVSAFGAATEAGQMAVGQQENQFTQDQMELAQQYNVELKNMDQAHALEMAQNAHAFLMQEMMQQHVNSMDELKLSAEQQQALIKVTSDLEASFDSRQIKAMENAGLDYKDIAYYNRGKQGVTNAQARFNMATQGVDSAGNVIDALAPDEASIF